MKLVFSLSLLFYNCYYLCKISLTYIIIDAPNRGKGILVPGCAV
nr:MAG TPA: hypothetical protein [Caudoviricetes sp.]